MIRCRTSYSSYPQDLWKRSLILRNLTIEARQTLVCSKNKQIKLRKGEASNDRSLKSVSHPHQIRLNCALMKIRNCKQSGRRFMTIARTRLRVLQTLH